VEQSNSLEISNCLAGKEIFLLLMQASFSLYYPKKSAISVSLGNIIPSHFYKINSGFHFHGSRDSSVGIATH
jgi:hypothetical protein